MQPDSPTLSATSLITDENTPPPSRGLRLSRPPHPYHRNRSESSGSQRQKRSNAAGRRYLSEATNSILENGNNESGYFNRSERKIWRRSTSPSDSGTEADDESGNFLRVLPAPPIKLRKGLKDARGSAVSSPLLTPTYFSDEHQRSVLESRLNSQTILANSAVADEESSKIREKFTKRRRAELVRRLSETLLLGAVGVIACRNESSLILRRCKKGELDN